MGMVDQCDACTYYRTRYFEASPVGECRVLPPGMQGTHGHWPEVAVDDWCGDFEPVGYDNVALSGNVLLTATTLVLLLDVAGDTVFTAIDLTGCQLTNIGTQAEIVLFYDGNSTSTLITQLGCSANDSSQYQFPQIIPALSGQIWVALASAGTGVYVAAQGKKIRP